MTDYLLHFKREDAGFTTDEEKMEARMPKGALISYFPASRLSDLSKPAGNVGTESTGLKSLICDINEETDLPILATWRGTDIVLGAEEWATRPNHWRKRVNILDEANASAALLNAIFRSPHNVLTRVDRSLLIRAANFKVRPTKVRSLL